MKTAILFLSVLALSCTVCAQQKGKKESGKVVDAGSFGIFVNGKRIGTETFRIEERGYFTSLSNYDNCRSCYYDYNHDLYQGETNVGVFFRF